MKHERTQVLGVRLAPDEMRWLRAAARRAGIPLSTWARQVLKRAAGWVHPAADDAAYAAIKQLEGDRVNAMSPAESLEAAFELADETS